MANLQISPTGGLNDVSMDHDGEEIELERIVFGDDAGFHERIKSYSESAAEVNTQVDSLDKQQPLNFIKEDDLEGMNESDVRYEIWTSAIILWEINMFLSCSSSTLVVLQTTLQIPCQYMHQIVKIRV